MKANTLTIITNNICDIVILARPNILPTGVKNTNPWIINKTIIPTFKYLLLNNPLLYIGSFKERQLYAKTNSFIIILNSAKVWAISTPKSI